MTRPPTDTERPLRPRTGSVRAVTFDYWDTLYDGSALPERVSFRQAAMRRMLGELGCSIADQEFLALYRASGEEAERWWREEHRGYSADERIRWMLQRLAIDRPRECEHIRRAIQAVDDALLMLPPRLLPGAAEMLVEIAPLADLAIVSDTGFASGRAQDRLLEKDGLRRLFRATVYSVDVGFAKPRAEPFRAVLEVLGVPPHEVIHIGDNERTDVRGALAAGMRAVRVDVTRPGGPSAAEFVATTLDDLTGYLVSAIGAPKAPLATVEPGRAGAG